MAWPPGFGFQMPPEIQAELSRLNTLRLQDAKPVLKKASTEIAKQLARQGPRIVHDISKATEIGLRASGLYEEAVAVETAVLSEEALAEAAAGRAIAARAAAWVGARAALAMGWESLLGGAAAVGSAVSGLAVVLLIISIGLLLLNSGAKPQSPPDLAAQDLNDELEDARFKGHRPRKWGPVPRLG